MITNEIARDSKIGDVFKHTIIKGLSCKVTGNYCYNKAGDPKFTLKVESKHKEFYITDDNKRNWKV